MSVQIKELRSGRIRSVDRKSADVLVKLKRAEYYQGQVPTGGTYQTKVMTAAPISPAAQPVREPAPPPPAQAPAPDVAPPVPPKKETQNKPLETVAENSDTKSGKKRGRPSKADNKKSQTKVLTAKE